MPPQQPGDRGNAVDIPALSGDPQAHSPEAAMWQTNESIAPITCSTPSALAAWARCGWPRKPKPCAGAPL